MTTSEILHDTIKSTNAHITDFCAAVKKLDSTMYSKRTSKVRRISIHSYSSQVLMNVTYDDGSIKMFTIPDGRAIFREYGYDALYSKVFQILYDEDVINYW